MPRLCVLFDNDFCDKYKKKFDDYAFIKYRNEARSIGSEFYDQLNFSVKTPSSLK